MALIKGGPADEQENAKKFIDFMCSAEGQNLYAENNSFRVPTNTEATVADGLVTLGEFNPDLVTDEMIAKVEEVKAQIVSGEWDVFDGKTEIMDNEGNAHTLEGADYGSCNWYYENVNVL